MNIEHPLVRFIIIAVLVLVLIFACGNASAEELPDTLRREAQALTVAPCLSQGVRYTCHVVEYQKKVYIVLVRQDGQPVQVILGGKIVWNRNSVKI